MNIEPLPAPYPVVQNQPSPLELSKDLADAITASRYGQIATLIIPNDYQQAELSDEEVALSGFAFDPLEEKTIEKAAELIKSHDKVALIIGGRALRKKGLMAAARIKELKGCDLITDIVRLYGKRGMFPEIMRIPYFPGTLD
jgi:acetolactate synthase-1/2/3 large subunit